MGWEDRTVLPVAVAFGGQSVKKAVWMDAESEQELIQ